MKHLQKTKSLVRGACLFFFITAIGFSAEAAKTEPNDYIIDQLEFHEARIVDVVRVLSELSGVNIVATEEASSKQVTVFLRNITVGDAVDTLCKIAGLWYREDPETGVFRIMETEAYQKDIVVFRNDVLRVFTLRHYNVVSAAYAIENLFGDRVELRLDRRPDETGLGGGGFGNSRNGGNNGNNGNNGGFSNSDNQNFNNAGNQFNQQNGNGSGGGGNSILGRNSVLDGVELTADQLAAVEQGGFGSRLLPGIATTELVALTAREPEILVTTSRLHNLVMVRTSDEAAIREIEGLLAQIDRVAPQVLLELKILDLSLGDSFRSVFDIDYTSDNTASGPESSAPRNPLLPGGIIPPAVALGVGNFPLQGGTLLFQWMNDNIRMRLQLLESDNRVTTVSSPVLLASNNTPSRLFVGEEVVLTTGVTTTSEVGGIGQVLNLISPETQVVSIGNTLEILPRVNSDGSVTLTVTADVSSLKPNGSSIPVTGANGVVTSFPVDAVNNSTLEGTFLAKDGLTVAVGGLIRRTSSNVSQKVPWLGDIPLLGFFFKKEERSESSSELVLLITPRVFLSGEDAEMRSLSTLDELTTEGVADGFASDPSQLRREVLEGSQFDDFHPMDALDRDVNE
jgi:general secretion pathway protein D